MPFKMIYYISRRAIRFHNLGICAGNGIPEVKHLVCSSFQHPLINIDAQTNGGITNVIRIGNRDSFLKSTRIKRET